jgi:hypothetical protein
MTRMGAVPEVKAVLDGASKWGALPLYCVPFPN